MSALTRAFLIIVDFDRFNPISVSGYRTYVDVHIKTVHTHLGLMDIQDLQKTEAITLTTTILLRKTKGRVRDGVRVRVPVRVRVRVS